MGKKICVIDDDSKLVSLVIRYLKKNGFDNVTSANPEEIINKNIDYDLIILDIMMPEIDGFELCKIIRQKSDVFIIFLSAKSESFDKILGLELGADDYLTKPFEPRELLARINTLFRRNVMKKEVNGKYKFKEFYFDTAKQIIIKNENEIMLTTYEYLLLRYFCENTNIVLSRDQILDYLETHDFFSYGRSIDIGISRLRKKLEDDTKKPKLLKTVWGRGYQLSINEEN